MMAKSILFSFFLIGGTLTGAVDALPLPQTEASFSRAEEQQFYAELEAGIQKSERHTEQVKDSLFGLPTAKVSVQIKQTLYKNFKGSPAVQVPEIRQALLKVFANDEITAADLANLKQAINDWQQSMMRRQESLPKQSSGLSQ